MKSKFSKFILIAFSLILASNRGLAATTCDQIFTSVKPFTVTDPGLIGRMLGKINKTEWYESAYESVLPYASTSSDFMDLFASFQRNKIPEVSQRSLLKKHPGLISLKATDSVIDNYISYYNRALKNRIIDSRNSPLFKEIWSPKIVDQCSSGTCWINATTSVLENALSPTQRIEISEQYVYLQSLIDRALNAAMDGGEIKEGGSFQEFFCFVRDHGYVLTADWKPQKDIYKERAILTQTLNELTQNYRTIFSWLLQSFNPEENIQDAKKAFISEAKNRLAKIVGDFPDEGTIKRLPKNMNYKIVGRPTLEMSFDLVLSQIASEIEAGHEVYISLKSHWSDFGQSKVMTKSSGDQNMGHAMAVVGYIKNSHGQVELLKIKNSWGAQIADKGYIYLSRSFIEETFVSAGFFVENSTSKGLQ